MRGRSRSGSFRGVVALSVTLLVAAGTAYAASFSVSPLRQVSDEGSPFLDADVDGPSCNGVPGAAQVGTNFEGTEVESWVAANPSDRSKLIGVWQQDRWSDGGANGTLAAYSADGGLTWARPANQPAFTRCTGGSGETGGYERATDPWVSISPDGSAYYMSLGLDIAEDNNHAMLVSRSADGGRTWGPVTVLRRDTSRNVLNDKNTITADQFDARYVYAIWDRLEFPKDVAARQAGEHALGFRGPTWFTRTTDGGATWEPARMIFDPGAVNQTIGNQIVVTGDGALVDGFNLIYNFANAHKVRGMNVAVRRSEDHGATWSSKPTIVDSLRSVGVTDPNFGSPVRTGDIIPQIASDPRPGHGDVYAVWQDARTTGGKRDQIAFAKSTDGGKTWTTTSYAINTDHNAPAFTPSIAVAPDGTISVAYYDFRHDTKAVPLVTSAWILHSHDGGATWDESQVGDDFDMSSGAEARGYFIGDYTGLAVTDGAFLDFPVRATGATPPSAGATSPAPGSNVYAGTAK